MILTILFRNIPGLSLLLMLSLFNSHGQKLVQSEYLRKVSATKQVMVGGAAGSPSRTSYLITCRVLSSAELGNVKATIDNEDLPVIIVYKSAEYKKIHIARGDTLLFRITRQSIIPRKNRHGISQTKERLAFFAGPDEKAEIAVIHYTINNRKKEILRVESFAENTPGGYQRQL